MRSRLKRVAALVGCLAAVSLLARADLAEWVRYVEKGSALEGVFFRDETLPGGELRVRRTPRETREGLTALINAAPAQGDLFSLRAREAERHLDFIAAEADWKRFAELAEDPAEGQLALAEFYGRRLRPREEIAALMVVGRSPNPEDERFVPVQEQRSWRAFEGILETAKAHLLEADVVENSYRAWTTRYSTEWTLYQRFLDFLIEEERFDSAEALIAEYRSLFPGDAAFSVKARAAVARARQDDAAAVAVFEGEFDPLWPYALVEDYFELLDQSRRLRLKLDEMRSRVAADPNDLSAAAWIYYYYQRQGNVEAAQIPLADFRRGKDQRGAQWLPNELFTLATLYDGVRNSDETARYFYSLYSLDGAQAADREKALAGLIELLLRAPEQNIAFGSGDFTFYRDIAQMDDHPGFLNGILSLLFNTQFPQYEYSSAENVSTAYFHRSRAAELLDRFDREFPNSDKRSRMHWQVIEALAVYGDNEALIRRGTQFLSQFDDAYQRTEVSFLMAEAYARTNQAEQEFRIYESLLTELARRADGVPLGNAPEAGGRSGRYQPSRAPRSPQYARVLDRYIARLAILNRMPDALRIYAQQISANPDDPGLYERLASFLDVNGLSTQVEQVYRRAMGRFQDRSWHHRLARWYLTRQRAAEFRQVTDEVNAAFSGTELEAYFREVVAAASLDPQLYLQINLYAHGRFPANLTFVNNLLRAYTTKGTENAAAWESLLRRYWFFDESLRRRFFEFLSRTGRLDGEVAAIGAQIEEARQERWNVVARTHPAAGEFSAEARLWKSHFEEASAVMVALAADAPADDEIVARAATLHRSLAYADPLATDVSVAMSDMRAKYAPGEIERLEYMGDTWADRGRFDRAGPLWEGMATARPGRDDGYIGAATVFWDYYLFPDAMRVIEQGRSRLGDPSRFAFEAGAIEENRRNYSRAIAEYLQGALAGDGFSPARNRLVQLSKRPAHRDEIEQATARLTAGRNPSAAAVELRVAVLEAQERREDLGEFLSALVTDTSSFELLERVDQIASSREFDEVRVATLRRKIGLTSDPVDGMRMGISLMRLLEFQGREEDAQGVIEELYAANPTVLGVIRGAVDFAWRRKRQDRALTLLEQAAGRAYPKLRDELRLEAARKAVQADQFARARGYLTTLLESDPFQAQYLAVMAESYGEEGDDQGLRDFYQGKIQAIDGSDMPAARKKEQLAALRRGLIPALKRLGAHSEAVDQYVEIINRFPEDRALVDEAAEYARKNFETAKLLDFYRRTSEQSPRDVRYHRVLAWLNAHLEDYPAAIEAYGRAITVRPDSLELLEARMGLRERLLRFEAALEDARELYKLSHEAPRWMDRIAELEARRGNRAEAVAAVKKARIEGRPERPEHFFNAAEQLEQWLYLEEARELAEQGLAAAGDEALQRPEFIEGNRLYARLMTRVRRHEDAYARLRGLWPSEPNDFAQSNLQLALQSIGEAAGGYFTPEEKTRLAAFLEREKATSDGSAIDDTLLPIVEAAGLAAIEANWRVERMMAEPGSDQASQHLYRLSDLQRRRLRFEELGRQLERYWAVYPQRPDKDGLLAQAAEAFHDAGAADDEFRVLETQASRSSLSGEALERYFSYLLDRNPTQLVSFADPTRRGSRPDEAANFVMASGDLDLAMRAIAARGKGLPAVWTRGYSGLTGLYFGSWTPRAEQGFVEALGGGTIGERVGSTVDRNQRLAGELWFYYAGRHGEYLADHSQPGAADFLPAALEGASAHADSYFELARYYEKEGESEAAAADFEHVLELKPNDPAAHSHLAALSLASGRREEALTHWRAALDAYRGQVQRSNFDPEFWEAVPGLIRAIGEASALTELRGEVDALLELYARRNSAYRTDEFFRAYWENSPDRAEARERILNFSENASSAVDFLSGVAKFDWLPLDFREAAIDRTIAAAKRRRDEATPQSRYFPEQQWREWQVKRLEFLLANSRASEAWRSIADGDEEFQRYLKGQQAEVLLRLAAAAGELDFVLENWMDTPGTWSGQVLIQLSTLPQAAREIRKAGNDDGARRLLDHYYSKRFEAGMETAADFLGLAEIRFEQGRDDEALALLKRLTLLPGEPFEQHRAAAALLMERQRPAEAADLLAERATAAPWDLEAKLELASARKATGVAGAAEAMTALAQEGAALYGLRSRAAENAEGSSAALGSEELRLLASAAAVSVEQALKPYFHPLLLKEARRAGEPQARLGLLRGAFAERPLDLGAGSEALFELFQAARAAGQHRFAVAVVEPLLAQSGLAYQMQQGESTLAARVPEEQIYSWVKDQFLAQAGFDDGERASTAAEIADSLEQSGRSAAGWYLYSLALEFDAADAARDSWRERRGQLEAALRTRAEDSKRRPLVGQYLEQDRLVRPRIETTEAGR